MSGATLEVRRATVAYRGRTVVDDVTFEVGAGELVCLIGPNGAGKSTLLRAISGTVALKHGLIAIDGVPRAELDRVTLAKRLAVVPGQTTLGFPVRVEDLVALGRVPHEHPLMGLRPADRAAIDRAIARVGIAHLSGRDVRELSLGERQLVVLAMTVAQGAQVLLLDEPTVHLDLRHQVEVMQLLTDLAHNDGVTVLTVLHDLSLASHFFPRLLLLDEGRLLADGPPSDVLTPERVRDVYRVDSRLIWRGAPAAG